MLQVSTLDLSTETIVTKSEEPACVQVFVLDPKLTTNALLICIILCAPHIFATINKLCIYFLTVVCGVLFVVVYTHCYGDWANMLLPAQ